VSLDEAREVIRSRGMEALQAVLDNRESTTTQPSAAPSLMNSNVDRVSPSLREGPQRLPPGDFGIGRMVQDLELQDLHEKRFRLSDFANNKAIVIAMTNTSCPVCKKYLPTLAEIEKRFKDKSIAFVYVNPTASDKLADIHQAIKTNGLTGSYVRDSDGIVATAIGATHTTDVILLDAKRTVIYRGAVDDQYGFGYTVDAPRENYLVDAIEATLANEIPLVQATSAPGCPLDLDSTQAAIAQSEVTYHNRISRIVQKHCLGCHRDGGVAPFALSSYEEVASQSGAIRQVLEKGVMPPWFAATPAHGQPSLFANDCSLAKPDKSDLLNWLAGGKPEGDPADAPVPRIFAEGWQIGKPDHIVQLPKPIAVKASGTMPYQHVTVETGLTETK
jgi:thiol-disulfide isomerase/thioredoxin